MLNHTRSSLSSHAPSASSRRLRSPAESRTRARGFTLIELLVSMVAGLAVALAVIALGRDATNTFQDEARSSTAEMSLRLAKERLRGDLERIGFMSTANIALDPAVARQNGDLVNNGAPIAPTNVNPLELGISSLVGVRLQNGGSVTNGDNTGTDQASGFSYSVTNGLHPDRIEVSGNFTTSDEYTARVEQPPPGGCGARLHLNQNDPAVLRLLLLPDGTAKNAADATLAIASTFTPVTGQPFGVRVSDNPGTHYQYASVCISGGVASAAAVGTYPFTDVYVNVQYPLLTTTTSPNGVNPGNGAGGNVVINPFQTVRWEVRRVANGILDGPTTATNQARFELVRTWIPTTYAPFSAGVFTNCPQCAETVSEFAVDLKFAFSVQNPITPTVITTFDMDDAVNNAAWAPTTGFIANNQGPQKIRGARFRLATRAAMPDRISTLAAPPNYLYRYCTDPVALGACKNFARVRTTVEDVYLSNQARVSF